MKLKPFFLAAASLVLLVLFSGAALAQINWFNSPAWMDGTSSKVINFGETAVLNTGYFGSSYSQTVEMEIFVNHAGLTVSKIGPQYIDVTNLGYETVKINPGHYQTPGEFTIVISLDDGLQKVSQLLILTVSEPQSATGSYDPGEDNGNNGDLPHFIASEIPDTIKDNINPDNFLPGDEEEIDLIENQVPVMNSLLGSYLVKEGKTLNLAVSGTDADSIDLDYEVQYKTCIQGLICFFQNWSADLQPEEISFNEETGQLLFKPNYDYVQHPDQKKTIKVRFRAYDLVNYSAWVYTDLVVEDVNQKSYMETDPKPLVSGDVMIFEAVVGQPFGVDLTAKDKDGDKVIIGTQSASGYSAPPGLSLMLGSSSHLAFLIGTPTAGGSYGTYLTLYDGYEITNQLVLFSITEASTPPLAGEGSSSSEGNGGNGNGGDGGEDTGPHFLCQVPLFNNLIKGCPIKNDGDGSRDDDDDQDDDGEDNGSDDDGNNDDQDSGQDNDSDEDSDSGDSGSDDSSTSSSLKIASISVPDIAYAGDITVIKVKLANQGSVNLEDLRITVWVEELGDISFSGQFDLGEEETVTKLIYLPISDLPLGTNYLDCLVKVRVMDSSRDWAEVGYRQLTILG
ncbi:MAG TPA: hypothetical protein VJC39_03390 [Candidatus Nanoarchaeia archaeon]|nr:hypothetical protein [Candidatus Nanoarchaeia archaeon]